MTVVQIDCAELVCAGEDKDQSERFSNLLLRYRSVSTKDSAGNNITLRYVSRRLSFG